MLAPEPWFFQTLVASLLHSYQSLTPMLSKKEISILTLVAFQLLTHHLGYHHPLFLKPYFIDAFPLQNLQELLRETTI